MINITEKSLRTVPSPRGDVSVIVDDPNVTIAEAYVSIISPFQIKGLTKHTAMSLRLTVLVGRVKFFFLDHGFEIFEEKILDPLVSSLEVGPDIWFAFKNVDIEGEQSLVLNLPDMRTKDDVVLTKSLDELAKSTRSRMGLV